jgi:hypothetical protein
MFLSVFTDVFPKVEHRDRASQSSRDGVSNRVSETDAHGIANSSRKKLGVEIGVQE